MPNIREFQAPELGLHPSEIGVDATAAAARRGGAFFNQAGQAYDSLGQRAGSAIRDAGDVAVQQISHQEITHGAATFAQLHADLTDKWNETVKNADPNDTSVAGKFNETVLAPALDKFQQAFNTEPGQKWAESRIDALRDHMFQRASADMSTLAGDAVTTNIRKMSNSWSNSARGDPSSVPFLLDTAESSIGAVVDSSPGLKGTAAAKVKNEVLQKAKEDIVRAGALGAIEKSGDPERAADEFTKRYPDYVNGSEVGQFARAAKVQNNANLATVRQSTLLQKQLEEAAVHKGANKVFTDNVTVDPQTNQVRIDPKYFRQMVDVAKDHPDAPNASTVAKTYLDWAESQQKKTDAQSDPALASSLDGRMFSSDNPTSAVDILLAETQHKLSRQDGAIRLDLIKARDAMPPGAQFKFALDGAKELIEGRTAGEKAIQSGKYPAFMQDFLAEYQRQKSAHTLPPNALNLRDPESLISKMMAPYKSPLASAISGNGGVGTPSINLTAPGKAVTGATTENLGVVNTKADYDKLAPGASYLAPDGSMRRKGGK